MAKSIRKALFAYILYIWGLGLSILLRSKGPSLLHCDNAPAKSTKTWFLEFGAEELDCEP